MNTQVFSTGTPCNKNNEHKNLTIRTNLILSKHIWKGRKADTRRFFFYKNLAKRGETFAVSFSSWFLFIYLYFYFFIFNFLFFYFFISYFVIKFASFPAKVICDNTSISLSFSLLLPILILLTPLSEIQLSDIHGERQTVYKGCTILIYC